MLALFNTATSAITSPAETTSSLSSTIHSKLTSTTTTISTRFPNLSKNLTDNYSYMSETFINKYNELNESYPGLSSGLTNTRSTVTSTFSDGTTFIYSLPNTIGDTVLSYTSILLPVDDSQEREIRTPPNDNLSENVIPLNDERIEIVNHILNLYGLQPSKECFKHYDDDVILEAFTTYTVGLQNLKAQFYMLPIIFVKSTTVNYKILENTASVLRISLNQKYTLPYVNRAVVQHCEIILSFNDNKKISKHTDLFGGKPIGKEGILRKGTAKIISILVSVPKN